MILNVSGRTDIVAFYMEWFMNRYKEGFVDVRNPFNDSLVNRIKFSDVDLIFFCTKNPIPILKYIKDIDKKMYFHITLTSYKEDIECKVPSKEGIINAIKELSSIVGKDNIVIRYDPIFISDKYNLDYHVRAFEKICSLLEGYVSKILVHFIDDYKNVKKNYNYLKYRELNEDDYRVIGTSFSDSARRHNMVVFTCNENRNLVEYGLVKDECLSRELAYKLTGKLYKKKWNSRKDLVCQCVSMVDIGVYNTCLHFCKYCYANYDEKKVNYNILKHNVNSSLLIGELKDDDIIKERVI